MGSTTALLNLVTTTVSGSLDPGVAIVGNGSFNGNQIGDDITIWLPYPLPSAPTVTAGQ